MNIFIGLPIKDGLMTESFLAIFSKASIFGGVLFVLSALSLGYAWIKMTLGKDFKTPSKTSILWISGSSLFAVALLFLALTNKYKLFETGLFADTLGFWAMPILAMLLYIVQFFFHVKEKYTGVFISLILAIILVIFTGFSATFPYILGSTVDPAEGILIVDAASSVHTLKIITGVAIAFLPVVIGYQAWKYIKFWRKF